MYLLLFLMLMAIGVMQLAILALLIPDPTGKSKGQKGSKDASKAKSSQNENEQLSNPHENITINPILTTSAPQIQLAQVTQPLDDPKDSNYCWNVKKQM